MDVFKVSKRILCKFLIENHSDLGKLVTYLQNEYTLNAEQINMINNALNQYFFSTFQKKWKESLYMQSKFEKRFEKWLGRETK